ncbi:MAG: N-acetylmuramoyl-L-alanine amidase [Geminicoccaceae bacterium]
MWVGLLMLVSADAAEVASVKSVRFGANEAFTRLVVEVSEPVPFAVRILPSRTRLVIEIGAARTETLRQGAAIGIVDTVRVDRLATNKTRIDAKLASPGQVIRDFYLEHSGGVRYVVDLTKVEPSEAETVVSEQVDGLNVEPAAGPMPAMRPNRGQERQTALAPATPRAKPGPAARSRVSPPPTAKHLPVRRPQPTTAPAGDADHGRDGEKSARPVVVIDAGHGGQDPGAISPSGVQEKTITLAMAKDLAQALEGRRDYEVRLTRTTDRSMHLSERLEFVAEAKADLMISLHVDSFPDHQAVRGSSVYTLSTRASDPEAARKAQEENAADERLNTIIAQPDPIVRAILTSIMQTSTTNRSVSFAKLVVNALDDNIPMVKESRRFANFMVLRSLQTPSILVELGYLSNAKDERALQSPDYRRRIADALVTAVDGYFGREQALN